MHQGMIILGNPRWVPEPSRDEQRRAEPAPAHAMLSWWRPHGAGWGGQSCGHGGRHWGGRSPGQGGGGHDEGDGEGYGGGDGFGGGPFGVRRPLRFLAYKLELDERQVGELARILDELKTERAQAEVDRRRSLSAFADAVGGDTFDEARAKEAATIRVRTAERLRDAVMGALTRLHALLDKEQRERLAYLIRTGVLTL